MIGEELLHRLIDRLYESAVDDQAWVSGIQDVAEAFGCEVGGLTLHEMPSTALRIQHHFGHDEHFRESYAALTTTADMAPVWRMTATGLPARVLNQEIARRDGLVENTRFFAEWLRPQQLEHVLMALLAPSDGLLGGLFIARTGRSSNFEAEDLAALHRLQPHLNRALQVRLRLESVAGAQRVAFEALDAIDDCVLLLDTAAVVCRANHAAESLLMAADGMRVISGRLACDHPDDTRALRRQIGVAASDPTSEPSASLPVRRRSGRRPLLVLVARLRTPQPIASAPFAQVMVLISDPDRAVRLNGSELRRLYGLTAAEARVAEAIPHCERLADIAERFGVSLSAVRIHLQRVFEKTRTHRQSELVRLIMAHRPLRNGHQGEL